MPNTPYLDASVRWRIRTGRLELQEPGHDDRVAAILSAGLATEVVRPISAGKEAEVLLCAYNGAPIAVKMYRLFRTSHKGDGPVKADAMGWRAAEEFEAMHRAWKGGVRVPTPARRVEHMFSMRYLGDDKGPAPRLVDVRLEDPEPVLQEILSGIETMARAGGVHTEPSASNLPFHRGPCSGHATTKSSSSPWHSGPPTCVHRLSRQYTWLPILNRATARCPRVAHVGSPSRSSLSGPASIRMRPSLLTRPS